LIVAVTCQLAVAIAVFIAGCVLGAVLIRAVDIPIAIVVCCVVADLSVRGR
jgi:hypothetical protein